MINNEKCCIDKKPEKKGGIFSGFIFGLIPHSFCIFFILLSVLGATTGIAFIKQFLLIPDLFNFLIVMSLIFATISVFYYLNMIGNLSFAGAKRSWRYISTVYISTIVVNILFFYLLMPVATNLHAVGLSEEKLIGSLSEKVLDNLETVSIDVGIPCSGHSTLIVYELNTIKGVKKVSFKMPNIFNISFDSKETSVNDILSLKIFNTYKAEVIN